MPGYCRSLLLYITIIMAGIASRTTAMPSTALVLPSSRTVETRNTAITAHYRHLAEQDAAIARMQRVLIRAQAVAPSMCMPVPNGYVLTGAPARGLTSRSRGRSQVLTFTYSDWGNQETTLRTFLEAAYPEMVAIYGEPSTAGALTVVQDATVPAGGILEINQSTGAMVLRLRALPSGFGTADDTSQYARVVIQQVLHAFHGPALLGYDAWEDGMSLAAATLVMRRMKSPYADFDIELSPLWLLPIYDILNQPELATPSYVPMQSTSNMYIYRAGMAMAAWLKVYTERGMDATTPSAFAKFNVDYYSAFAASPEIAQDVARLKNLMAGAVPTVEGEAFNSWYDKQYALQTKLIRGAQMYVFATALEDSFPLVVHHYQVSMASGDAVAAETPLSGTATCYFTLYDGVDYSPEEGNTITLGDAGVPGVGSLAPSFYNIYGDAAPVRITTAVSLNGLQRELYYPYLGYGSDTSPNHIFGSLIGSNAGTVRIATSTRGMTATPTMGAFSVPWAQTYGPISGFYRVRYEFTGTNGNTIPFIRNIGPGGYAAMLTLPESVETFKTEFPSGMSLVSFPVIPLELTDPATLFGFASSSTNFRFAWWKPNATTVQRGQYLYYPHQEVNPIIPGRGYWISLPNTQAKYAVAIQGMKATSIPDITLEPGWNLIGSLYATPVNPWYLEIRATDGTVKTLANAVRAGDIGPIWTYNAGNQYYEPASTWHAWEGAWIYNAGTTSLSLVQKGVRRATQNMRETAAMPMPTAGWDMELLAYADKYRDSIRIGVSSTARHGVDGLDWQKPPAIGTMLRVALTHPERKSSGPIYATDFRTMVNPMGETWDFTITCPQRGPVTLTVPKFPTFPGRYRMALEDGTTGTRHYLRTAPAYTFTANGTPEAPELRQFRLIIESKPAGAASFLGKKTGTPR